MIRRTVEKFNDIAVLETLAFSLEVRLNEYHLGEGVAIPTFVRVV